MRLILLLAFVSGGSFASPPARNEMDASARTVDPVSNPAGDSTEMHTTRLAIVAGTAVAGIVTVHIYQSNGWWKDNRSSFHFQEDLKYGLWVDKIGHVFGAAALTWMLSKSLQWANFSETNSLWWGAAGSTLFQTYIEVEDGFSTWGFDRVDFASDLVGAFYPVAQHYSPFLQNFNLKFSYHPSPLLNSPGGSGFKGQKHLLFDDYEGQTLWFSIRVNGLLPRSLDPLWPDWLCLAVGYGARDIVGPVPYAAVILSLDYDMTEIIPQETSFLKTLSEALNFIRLPAPAVRITHGAIWYGLYF